MERREEEEKMRERELERKKYRRRNSDEEADRIFFLFLFHLLLSLLFVGWTLLRRNYSRYLTSLYSLLCPFYEGTLYRRNGSVSGESVCCAVRYTGCCCVQHSIR